MIITEATRNGDKVKVTFLLPAGEFEGHVFVVGDFNSWNPGATRLRRRGEIRTASVVLCAGRRYAFRYYCDGRWFNDDDADGQVANGFGGRNSVLDLTILPTPPPTTTAWSRPGVSPG
ncbi:MAG: isoamylase early set domain-containing protein [Acidimicrobiia bacterium]